MSELVQSGQFPGASGHHPDADQLSAFMEQALPAHEREQVLAHLAICQDCRETVALSLPELEPKPTPAHAHQPWWRGWSTLAPSIRGWSIFVPTALALAASVFFVVHLRRPNSSVSVPAQVATSEPPLPMTHMQQESAPPSEISAQQQARAKSASRASTSFVPAPRPIQRQQLDGLAPMPQVVSQAAPPPAAPPPPAALAAGKEQFMPAPMHAPASPVAQAAPAPGLVAPIANAGVGSASQAATVSSEPPLVNVAPASGNMTLALPAVRTVPIKNPLPSGLAVSSIAANGPTLLAIDAHNAVFLSGDFGEHWTAVSVPWRNHAVHVSLVSRAAVHVPVTGTASGRDMAAFASAVRLQPAATASLSGVVADASGAVIPGASVTIRNASTSAERTVTTDASGHYLAETLAPGGYSIEATAPGFVKQYVADVAVDASRQNTENLTLQVGSVSETVDVASETTPVARSRDAKNKALKSSQAAAIPSQTIPTPAIFEITTDTGERWTSADGILWQREH